MNEVRAAVYDSLGGEYERAFDVFLANTDQKDKARGWLETALDRLPERGHFVDAGAGTGKVTAWLAPRFKETTAIEPNPHLRRQLAANCPGATIVPLPILECTLDRPADFVLASHVFYYIPAAEWVPTLERLASFLAPQGVLVVILQNPGTDCMALVEYFHGQRFHLQALAQDFSARHTGMFNCRIETVDSHITAPDAGTAYTIAEFMLNLLPMHAVPLKSDVEAFITRRFRKSGSGFAFSCSQDFLVVSRV
jgi:SAM-dependent methyltransferase